MFKTELGNSEKSTNDATKISASALSTLKAQAANLSTQALKTEDEDPE